MKEELIAGTHGVEGRYPFLDKEVVQEYLWLSIETKNSVYKRPLVDMFEKWEFPYVGGKTGFNPHWSLGEGVGEAEVQRIYDKEGVREDLFAKEKALKGEDSSEKDSNNSDNSSTDPSLRKLFHEEDSARPSLEELEAVLDEPLSVLDIKENLVREGVSAAEIDNIKTELSALDRLFPKEKLDSLITNRACRTKFSMYQSEHTCCANPPQALAVDSPDPDVVQTFLQNLPQTTQVLMAPRNPNDIAAQKDPSAADLKPQLICFPDELKQEMFRLDEARLNVQFLYQDLHEHKTKLEATFHKLHKYHEYLQEEQLRVRTGVLHLFLMRLARMEGAEGGSRPGLPDSPAELEMVGKKDIESFLDYSTVNIEDENAITNPISSRLAPDVTVLTCVSGGTKVVVSDLPVYAIFAGTALSQGLPVVNLCANKEWTQMTMRLKLYEDFLEARATEWREIVREEFREEGRHSLERDTRFRLGFLGDSEKNSAGGLALKKAWDLLQKLKSEGKTEEEVVKLVEDPRLFFVSDGMDVYFNDMAPVLEAEGARNTADLLRKRFERFLGKKIVVSSERLCG